MARIVIVGAGMAGLAAAARLATLGHRVVLCEAAGTHGGMVGRYAREGFAFDTGPTLLTLPAVYRDLFLKTGRDRLEDNVELRPVDPAARHLFPDGTAVELANASRAGVVRALDAALGEGAGERWSGLLERGRQVWEATRRPLLEEPLPADPAPLHGDPYPALRRRLRPTARTVAEIGNRELRDPRLAALLEEHAVRFGLDPRRVPGSLTAIPYMEQTFGVWYITGGMRALADAVLRRCEQRGVELRFGARVAEVLGAEAVSGVLLADGSKLDADTVLTSAAPPGAPAAPGRFTVLLALRGPRPADAPHRTVLHAADRADELDALFDAGDDRLCARPTLQLLRPDDPTLAAAGHHTAVLTATVPPQGRVAWTAERAAAYADALLEWAERAAPGLRAATLWREVRTPADTERETGAPGGSVAPPALAGAGGAFLAPPNRVGIPAGLYRIGGTAHPGGGLPRVGMSAAIAAELVGVPR
jgi:phytoene dehydrogenase-like protein